MKSFKFLILLFQIQIVFLLQGQNNLSILFVDDSDDNFNNSRVLVSVLDSLHIDYTYFDAVENGTPEPEQMNLYDLVIWHTSTSGINLHFWDKRDDDNEKIKAYLDNARSNMWLIGNDFMFDRYGVAPDVFEKGSFPYDYLGISQYKNQSYGDDGGKGVPFVVPDDPCPVEGLNNIFWQFNTLWWADQFEIRDSAQRIYLFGDENYVFSGGITGLLYERPNHSRVMTFGFDLALADNAETVKNTMSSVLNWWSGKISELPYVQPLKDDIQIAPSVITNNVLTLTASDEINEKTNLSVFDFQGRNIMTATNVNLTLNNNQIFLPDNMLPGVYVLRINKGSQNTSKRFVKL